MPRANFSQSALYEIGSAITLFQISNNTEEFLAALDGKPFKVSDVDAVSAIEIAVQAEELVEDFVIKQLKNGMNSEMFEHFIAELLRCMGYYSRVTRYAGDGGVDVIAHKDELGFEPPIIKVQCKQSLATIGGPAVQQLLGAIQSGEHALFVTLGDYTVDAIRIERGKSNLRRTHPASTPGRRDGLPRSAQAATAALDCWFAFQFQGSRSATLLAG